MKVYIAVHGEQHEGYRVVAVCRQKTKAIKRALGVRACFDGGWQHEEGAGDYWENGCDFVAVEEHEVK